MSTLLCPSPLVYGYDDSYTTLVVAGLCVIPCPNIEFSDTKWYAVNTMMEVMSVISMVLSFFVFIAHIIEYKRYIVRLMLLVGFFCIGLCLTIFFLVNGKSNHVICDTDAHFIEDGGVCIFQSGAVIFGMLWIEMWAVFWSMETYLHVIGSSEKYSRILNKRQFAGITFVVCLSAVLIPYFGGNLGFDPKSPMPICLYLFSDESRYFWYGFFMPMCLFCIIGTGFCVAGAVRMQKIFVTRNNLTNTANQWEDSVNLRVESSDSEQTKYGTDYGSREQSREQSIVEMKQDSVDSIDGGSSVASSVCSLDEQRGPQYTLSALWSSEDTGRVDDRQQIVSDSSSAVKSQVGSFRITTDIRLEEKERVTNTTFLHKINAFLAFCAETWKYNGTAILFLVVFYVAVFIIAPFLYVLFYVTYQRNIDAVEDFAACLIEASEGCATQTQDGVDACGSSLCGSYPEPHPNLAMVRTTT